MSITKEGLGPQDKRFDYPRTPKIPHVENWHGQEIIDDYDWLQDETEEVKNWDEAQNKFARKYLDGLPYRDSIKEGIKNWLDLGEIGCPHPCKDKMFQWKRKAGENHEILFVGPDLFHQTAVIDPNKMSVDGTTSVDFSSTTQDGGFIAYTVTTGGGERGVLKIKDIDAKTDLPDEIPNLIEPFVAWLPDNSGFYYDRYPEPGTVPKGEELYNQKIYFHKLRDSWKNDSLIFSLKDPYNDLGSVEISYDGKWAILAVSHGFTAEDLFVARLGSDPTTLDFKTLTEGINNHFDLIEFDGYFYIYTDYKASRYKIMRVPSDSPDLSDMSKWEEFIPEGEDLLEDFTIIGGKLILEYLTHAVSKIEVFDLKTHERYTVPLPALGTVTDLEGEEEKPDLFYTFESYTIPDSVHKLNLETKIQEKIDSLKTPADLSGIITEQLTYKSKDGTPVNMFVIKNKSTQNNGENKLILSGYGTYGDCEIPYFSGGIIEWVRSGGIFVMTNIRGGSENGESWHRAGMLKNKQNSFDDFISAAECLINNKLTRPEKLGILGGSAGGLLVGTAMTQRPELFGAVICQVPILDMIHFDRLKIGKAWRTEFGNPSNPKHFKFLFAYSPYHHVTDGIKYPAVLLQTGENDNRADPMHARKMAAKLQVASSSDKPVLLFKESKTGHGIGMPISKVLEEKADIYAFLESILGDK